MVKLINSLFFIFVFAILPACYISFPTDHHDNNITCEDKKCVIASVRNFLKEILENCNLDININNILKCDCDQTMSTTEGEFSSTTPGIGATQTGDSTNNDCITTSATPRLPRGRKD